MGYFIVMFIAVVIVFYILMAICYIIPKIKMKAKDFIILLLLIVIGILIMCLISSQRTINRLQEEITRQGNTIIKIQKDYHDYRY